MHVIVLLGSLGCGYEISLDDRVLNSGFYFFARKIDLVISVSGLHNDETFKRSSKLLPNYDRIGDFTAQRRVCFLAAGPAKRWPFPRFGKFTIQGGFAF